MEPYMCNGDSVIQLPAGLPTLTTPDGKVCYLDSNTVWIPTSFRPDGAGQEMTSEASLHVMSDPSSSMSDSSYQMHYSSCVEMDSSSTFGSGDLSCTVTSVSDMSEGSSLEQSGQGQDLTEMYPEHFTCYLPGLDEPLSTSTPVHTVPNMTWAGNSVSFSREAETASEYHVQPTYQRHSYRSSVPENRPLFEPQPLGAQQASEKRCVRRLFSESTEDEDSTFSSTGLTSLSSLHSSTLDGSMVTPLRQCSQQFSIPSGCFKSSFKRKLQSEASDVVRGGKLARVNANDVITEMELLRAVESLSHVRWDTPGA